MSAPPPIAEPAGGAPAPGTDIGWTAPLRWLRLGWRDYRHNPLPGLLHGGMVALFGLVLWIALRDQFWLLAGAVSGFLIVAPILASGLYAVSWHLERGEKVCCTKLRRFWLSGDRRLIVFGLFLALAGTGWVLTSAALITLISPIPIRTPQDFWWYVVLNSEWGLFELWLLLGALLAAPVFASTVMALPMLVDTRVPLWHAVRESWRACGSRPAVMALWAASIVIMVGGGIVLAMIGLVGTLPLTAYASWHAYRDFQRAGLIRPF